MFHSDDLNKTIQKEKEDKERKQNHSCLSCTKYSFPLPSGRVLLNMALHQKEVVEELRIQWKRLWKERVDDKVRAEGVATADYCDLFVEKGTIIRATRDFKTLNFKEILEQHQIENVDRFIPPDPQTGGWNKFIKTNMTNLQSHRKKRADFYRDEERAKKQQSKKGGRGWLHK
jgi:hypothetical protein